LAVKALITGTDEYLAKVFNYGVLLKNIIFIIELILI